MSIRVSVEGARGCGYRKAGGLYLVAPRLSEPCPRLPVEVTTCPTCGEGIRPARGWTWVDGGKLIPPTLHGDDDHDVVCPLSPKRDEMGGYAGRYEGDHAHYVSRLGDRCGLIWIGEQHYKTVREFTDEAAQMGVSRRITAVPRGFKAGETFVLLGHRKAILKGYEDPETTEQYETMLEALEAGVDEPKPVYASGIATVFRPTGIEYVVRPEDEEDEEFLDTLRERGIEPVKVVRAEQASLEEV